MTVADVVEVVRYLTRAEDIQSYVKVRSRFLSGAPPASRLLVVSQFVWPEFRRQTCHLAKNTTW